LLFTNPPSGLVVTKPAGTTGTLKLNWTDNSSTENGFEIYRSADNVNFTKITTTAANVITYSNTGLTAGNTYFYKVRGVKLQGSNVTSVTGFSNTANLLLTARAFDPNTEIVFEMQQQTDGLKIIPNPANDQIILAFKWDRSEPATIEITGASGKSVYYAGETINKGENKIKINIEKLQPGTYFVIIKGQNRSNMKKLIIIK
jgi:hypothetical protein